MESCCNSNEAELIAGTKERRIRQEVAHVLSRDVTSPIVNVNPNGSKTASSSQALAPFKNPTTSNHPPIKLFDESNNEIKKHYSHPKYKISFENIIGTNGGVALKLSQERLVSVERDKLNFKKQDVAVLEEGKLSLVTSSAPHYLDYAIIFSSALKLYGKEKFTIHSSSQEQVYLMRFARSYFGKEVFERTLRDIGGHAKWDQLHEAQKNSLLSKTASSMGNFDTWLEQHMEFKLTDTISQKLSISLSNKRS